MVSGQLSALLLDWTISVTELNISSAHKLLEKEPELLWTPIPQSLDDTDHVRIQLTELNQLGSSFQPVSAIQFTLLHYRDVSDDNINLGQQLDRFKFLSYLIEQSTLHDLDTRFWGECNNSTLHLVCFLGQQQIVQLLIEKGVSVNPTNDLGFLPRDVSHSELILNYLAAVPPPPTQTPKRPLSMNQKKEISRAKSVRPNYSTPDRFKLLRDLAEESSAVGDDLKKTVTVIGLARKKSEGHYFHKGRVKETQQKVSTEEEVVELKKHRSKRQLEVAQLVKKSAVKNNPLFKKLEKRSYTSPTPSPSTSASILEGQQPYESLEAVLLDEQNDGTTCADEQPTPKRNSKVISSLKTKSYVSSSIFVQADEENPAPPPAAAAAVPTISLTDQDTVVSQAVDESSRVTTGYLSGNETQGTTSIFSNEPSEDDYNNYYTVSVEPNGHLKVEEEIHQLQTSDEDNYYFETTLNDQDLIESLGIATAPIENSNEEGEQHVAYPDIHNYYDLTIDTTTATTNKSDITTSSDNEDDDYSDDDDDENEDDDDDDDEDYEKATPVQFATRLVSPVYKSVVILNQDKSNEKDETNSLQEQQQGIYFTFDDVLPKNDGSNNLFHDELKHIANTTHDVLSKFVEPSSPPPVRPQRSNLRRGSSSNSTSPISKAHQEEQEVAVMDEGSKEKKRMSGSQKAAWTMSMSSWAAILDREFNLDEVDQAKKLKQHKQLLEQQEAEKNSSNNVRQSTATMNYLESDKIQVSDDDDVNLMTVCNNNNTATMTTTTTTTTTRLDELTASCTSMLSLSSTLKFKDFNTPMIPNPKRSSSYQKTPTTPVPKPPQIEELPRLHSSKSISRKPIPASFSEPSISTLPAPKKYNMTNNDTNNNIKLKKMPSIQVQHRRTTEHGKLYLHVNGIQDILLPLPKDRAYVRCVVSDGRFEYMSRYEILSQNINFDYECVIDTHPDMIITISLHVRPDYVMKSRTPFSRLFSSKKKKESLSGYVNKEDGAIGQARFALAHMLPACTETTYLAGFHCFNAWYSRTFKERHRQKKKDPDQDVLKVVGNFDVEMLYVSIIDFQKPFPRNLRECDIAIKQLHNYVEDSSEKYHTF